MRLENIYKYRADSIQEIQSSEQRIKIEETYSQKFSLLEVDTCTFLLLPSIFPGFRVFSKESVLLIRWPKYWSFSFSNLIIDVDLITVLERSPGEGNDSPLQYFCLENSVDWGTWQAAHTQTLACTYACTHTHRKSWL